MTGQEWCKGRGHHSGHKAWQKDLSASFPFYSLLLWKAVLQSITFVMQNPFLYLFPLILSLCSCELQQTPKPAVVSSCCLLGTGVACTNLNCRGMH